MKTNRSPIEESEAARSCGWLPGAGLAPRGRNFSGRGDAFVQRQESSPLVFVVDDDPTIVRTIHGFLNRAGFRTGSAGDVASALEGIREHRPDLILLDINLPDGSGFDVCRSLQLGASSSTTPILFISADEDTATKVKGFEMGGVDYITKPIVGAEVIARVRTHLRLKRAYERLAELQADRVEQLASAQQNLMPRPEDFPEARFEVSIRQALAAGGDFYDVIPAGEGVVDYLVADASGHNLAASLWTASLKALAAEYAGPVNLPIEIVQSINSSLCRFLPTNAFFTLVYARLNHLTGRLSVINAGHPPAIVVRANGTGAEILRQEGDVVGAFADAVFGVAELNLKKGDRILFYTDGLIETGGSYEDGLQHLVEACVARCFLPLRELVVGVVDGIMEDLAPADDTLLVGVER
jgi:sigma-B regulation protein RsbU (phosphoserine phosphatase)